MSLVTWQETLITAQVDGTAVANSTTRTTLLPPQAVFTLKPNFFDTIGKQLLIKATGRISLPASATTARFDINFLDSAAVNVIGVADSGVMSLNTAGKTNVNWMLEFLMTARIIGAVAQLQFQGRWESEAVIGSPVPTAGGSGFFTLPFNAAPGLGAAFNSALSQQVDLRFTQNTLGTPPSVQLHQYSLIALN
jgi:hypothetical protein